MSPAILNGLPDRLFPVPLSGVNRDIEILTLNIVKSVNVLFRRVAPFLTSKIETDHATLAKIDGQFRHFERYVHIAHSTDNESRGNCKVFAAPLQTFQHS